MPLLFSLLGDTFGPAKRNVVSAGFGVAVGAGVFLGQVVAGAIGGTYGSWRTPFVVVALPAMVTAALIYFTTDEPARGGAEVELQLQAGSGGVAYTEKISCQKVKGLFKTRSNILAFMQGVPGCIPWGVIFAYFNDYLSHDRGFTILQATTVVTMFGIGGAIGSIGGGVVGQYLNNRRPYCVPLLMGTTTILGVFPCLYLFNHSSPEQMNMTCFVSFLVGLVSSITGSNIKAVLLNVNVPEVRGTVFSIFVLFDDLGKGTGPFFAAAMISSLGSRQKAFNLAIWAWVICGFLLMGIACTIEADTKKVAEALKTTSMKLPQSARHRPSADVELSDTSFISSQ